MFDDEHGDVVRAVTIPHECLEEQVGELIGGDMFGKPGEDSGHLGDADVEGSVAMFDEPVGEHDELRTNGKRRDVGGAAWVRRFNRGLPPMS